jgi:hypothetical protein
LLDEGTMAYAAELTEIEVAHVGFESGSQSFVSLERSMQQ